jgi:hypothetical protein
MVTMMDDTYIQELERKIADLKKRWPAHSIPPALMQELDELEEALAKALEQARQRENHA